MGLGAPRLVHECNPRVSSVRGAEGSSGDAARPISRTAEPVLFEDIGHWMKSRHAKMACSRVVLKIIAKACILYFQASVEYALSEGHE
jgi:hypothetical protein